jgi:hypothetical protein
MWASGELRALGTLEGNSQQAKSGNLQGIHQTCFDGFSVNVMKEFMIFTSNF